ncbi:MAG: DNA polymerase III subunit delta [Candidatus Yanofskybacteria bacterium RIFCSPHIGHO2_12_FULL_41_9]|nr:MAG: DNA polymerase III subunit delta [Candidatus Yanofskybacteria bacterium RIFCSPHIGHO2_12_FULL_41_9]
MIIFLYGSDSYRLKQAKDDIIGRYKSKYKSGFNLFNVDLSEISGPDLLEEALKSSSFFSEHKLIISKNIFAKKNSADLMASCIKKYEIADISDITLLVFEDSLEKEIIVKNKELFKLLSDKTNVVRVFEPLEETKLHGWIKKEFEVRGCSAGLTVVKKLINAAGNDGWSLINEIEKLAAYRQRGEIGEGDISMLVSAKTDLNIFNLIDAIGSRNNKKAVELLYCELKSGRDPYYILTMITYQFRNILIVSGLFEKGFSHVEIAKKSGLHPFVIKKVLANINRFKTADLKRIYTQLLGTEIGFKNGQMNIEDSLYGLFFSS